MSSEYLGGKMPEGGKLSGGVICEELCRENVQRIVPGESGGKNMWELFGGMTGENFRITM